MSQLKNKNKGEVYIYIYILAGYSPQNTPSIAETNT